ncbi:MAG: protease, partial [Myxococcales bacterium]|nr:protease [Myxococcales bacterium]
TDEERAVILTKLRYYYGRFVAQVARGRRLPEASVDAVGRGHVWSGDAALRRGLVDEFGGLMDAVAEAKRRAGLAEGERVALQAAPEEPGLLTQLLRLFGINFGADGERAAGDGGTEVVSRIVAPLVRGLPGSLLVGPSTPQARMEFEVGGE